MPLFTELGVLTALMTDDVEPFILGWRPKIRIDNLEVRLSGPGSTRGQSFASVPKLTFAQAVWSVYKMQFMRDLRALDQLLDSF